MKKYSLSKMVAVGSLDLKKRFFINFLKIIQLFFLIWQCCPLQ
ncbi:unnamed protein product [Callosobruchus maculatus]|uniref:Uncharacterized protein n=1 Tax=Callosobruchus maculatus TaxID=64391 RepID=A0A653C7F2_CALMS|nr:unnamed protein product [Callosobruchus maculatus]